jgi:uncharacterized membrane protein YphA (DoxX/SURF4 family)
MAMLFLTGRLVFGGFFIINGLNHFASHAMMAQFAAAKGVPMPELAVLLSGLLILFGGISILIGWRPQLGLAAIVLFLVGVSFPMHNFWAESGAERMNDFTNFTKNMALIGSTLMLSAVPRPWLYSVEDRLPVGVRH